MNANQSLHEKASSILAEVLELDKTDALAKIDKLCVNDSELKSNVLSLYYEIIEDDSDSKVSSKPTDKDVTLGMSRIGIRKRGSTETNLFSSKISQVSKYVFGNKRNRLITIILFLISLLLSGYYFGTFIRDRILAAEKEEQMALIKTNTEILEAWVDSEKKKIETIASDPVLIDFSIKIDSLENLDDNYELLRQSNISKQTTDHLLKLRNNSSFTILGIVSNRSPKYLLATSLLDSSGVTKLIGSTLGEYIYKDVLESQNGTTVFIPPTFDYDALHDSKVSFTPDVWCIFLTPIKDEAGEIKGILVSANLAKNEFSNMLLISSHGKTNETYAFDREARMISASRFTKELRKTALLNYDSTAQTIYKIHIQDPGGNVMDGFVPLESKVKREYTEIVQMAAEHIELQDSIINGAIVEPYKDYRGIDVIGAYHWFPKYEFGIITEEDASEALASLKYFRITFVSFFVIILILSFLLYNSNVRIARIGKKVDDLNKLGQYHLKEKLGEGGFGQVYKAEHSFLKTPVAIKILKKEFVGTDMLTRFEKEVKVTASLSNPYTIRVFDYGTSNNGQFYYVMEYLKGVSLDVVVQNFKVFPLEWTIDILLKVCLSLREAHDMGVVHRDVKPMNVMVCNQGKIYDMIKLLDFGLVKNLDTSLSQHTQINRIGGTPMFMAPERLRDPFNADQRVDIYAVGALGIYMLSGQMLLELLSQKMLSGAETVQGDFKNQLIERDDVPEQLKNLLQTCISFEPDKRPSEMSVLIDQLESLATEHSWTRKDAEIWWKQYDVYG